MIAFVSGIIVDFEENRIVLEQGGIGFQIAVPATVSGRLRIGEHVRIHTYMNVKEDDISLYGFLSKDDLKMFRMLLNVNGVGPKAALGVLSALSSDDLRFAVLADDAAAIAKAPGIGKKTAQKLILELKDKLNLEDAFEQKLQNKGFAQVYSSSEMTVRREAADEAVQALTALGYSATDALRAVKLVCGEVPEAEELSVEQILKLSLKKI